MAEENETILMKFLEELKESTRRIEAQSQETNRKLDKFIETTNETLTKIQVNQARLEGKIETLEVKLEEKTTGLQKGQDAINNKLNVQNTWQLSLITGLVIGLLSLVAAVGRVVFFPNP